MRGRTLDFKTINAGSGKAMQRQGKGDSNNKNHR